jgi:hypothetical protein
MNLLVVSRITGILRDARGRCPVPSPARVSALPGAIEETDCRHRGSGVGRAPEIRTGRVTTEVFPAASVAASRRT